MKLGSRIRVRRSTFEPSKAVSERGSTRRSSQSVNSVTKSHEVKLNKSTKKMRLLICWRAWPMQPARDDWFAVSLSKLSGSKPREDLVQPLGGGEHTPAGAWFSVCEW